MAPPRPSLPAADVPISAEGMVSRTPDSITTPTQQDALTQSRQVFLAGNDLLGEQSRWLGKSRFCILEIGTGLGLNFLATWQAWRAAGSPGELHFVAVTPHPILRDALASLLASYPELQPPAGQRAEQTTQLLLAQWPLPLAGVHRLHFPPERVSLTLAVGNVETILPQLTVQADAVFLTRCAPENAAATWAPRVLGAITRLCADDATLVTPATPVHPCPTASANNELERQLQFRGWQLERRPQGPHQDAILYGTLPRRAVPQRLTFGAEKHAIVIGAGLAGCTLTERLADRGWTIDLIDRQPGPAHEASGNPAGILLPRLALDDALGARLARNSYLYALRRLHELSRDSRLPLRWQACGVVQLAEDAHDEAYQRAVIQRMEFPTEFAQFLDQQAASALTGQHTAFGGWYFPAGGWVAPATLCASLLQRAAPALHCHFHTAIARILKVNGHWQAFDRAGVVRAEAPTLIVANAQAALELLAEMPTPALPLEAIRGQVSFLPSSEFTQLKSVICGSAYLTPPAGEFACVGATFDRDDAGTDLRQGDHQRNLDTLATMLPGHGTALRALDLTQLQGRVGFRSMSRDKLPLVGALADTQRQAPESPTPATLPRHDGLYGLLGLGARGMLWAPLAAELLASQLNGDPLPLEQPYIDALDPGRFYLRQLHHRMRT